MNESREWLDRKLIIDYQYSMTAVTQDIRPRGFADALGVFLSQLCLAHCFLLPAILAVLPSMDFHSIPGGEALHFGILLLSTPTAIYALLSGARYHGRRLPLALGVVGLSLLWAGSAFDLWHTLLSHGTAHAIGAAGSAFLVGAHLANRRAVKAASHDEAAGCGCGHTH